MLDIAKGYFEKGDSHSTDSALTTLLRYDSLDASTYASAGIIEETIGLNQKAELLYRKALDADSTVGMLWAKLGGTLMAQQRGTEALAAYARSAALDSTNADVFEKLTQLYFLNHDEAHFIAALRQSAKLGNAGAAKILQGSGNTP